MTAEQDIVLIHYEDQPLTYARIESINADHKPNWYHVKLLMLQIPLQVVTWILRDAYIEGDEFTMGGKRMRLAKVECPPDLEVLDPGDDTVPPPKPPKKVTPVETDVSSSSNSEPPPSNEPSPKPGKVIQFTPSQKS
jgi:hypothetical protein